MPVHRTSKNGKPGYKWGTSGKTYTYTKGNKASMQRAKNKASKQGRAIRASGYKG